jgi:hypothetical protein
MSPQRRLGSQRGLAPRSSPLGMPAFAGMTGHVRDRARHIPKTKWRPALLPASTVPRSVRLARKRSSLSQGGSGRGLAAPVGPSGSFAGILLFRFRFLRVPLLALRPDFGSLAGSELSALRHRNSVPYRTPTKRTSSVSFRETFRPGASSVAGPSKESGFGIGLRRRLALLPSGCPDLTSIGFGPKTSAALRGAVAESVTPFPEGRALLQEGNWHRFSIRPRAIWATRPVDNGDNGDNLG